MRVKGVTDVRHRPPDQRLVVPNAGQAAVQTSSRAARALHAALASRPHSWDAIETTLTDQCALGPVEALVTAALEPLYGWGGGALLHAAIRLRRQQEQEAKDDDFGFR